MEETVTKKMPSLVFQHLEFSFLAVYTSQQMEGIVC